MRAIVFDSDGVLVDSMPSHYKAWKIAFKEVCNIDVDRRTIYLLEGMRGIDLVKKVFELKNYHIDSDDNNNNKQKIAEQVSQQKNEAFREILLSAPPQAYRGVKHLIMNLVGCKKAVVSGSAREDVETLLKKSLGKGNLFDTLITADDSEKGKPDPSSFMNALNKIKVPRSKALIVENAPLGVEAANNAGISCIVVLNNTPLNIQDFRSVISDDKIFKETISAAGYIEGWCKSDPK
jgi:HAD superfamily hydrolase (TIGR01509 family)